MIDASKTSLLRSTLLFLAYFFICGIVHIIIVSIIAFFHFNLKHDLGIIEEWIFYQGWEIILITKFIAAFLLLKLINPGLKEQRSSRKFFLSRITQPKGELMVIIFVIFFCLFFFGKPLFSEHYNFLFLKTFFSYIGVISFFFIDLFVLETIDGDGSPSQKSILVKAFVFSSIFWFSGKLIYTYSAYFNFLVFFNFFICYILAQYGGKNFTNSIIYLILFVGPISTLFGMDLVWKDQYSLFVMSAEIFPYYYIILASLIMLYLSYKKRSLLWNQQT